MLTLSLPDLVGVSNFVIYKQVGINSTLVIQMKNLW